MEYVITAKRKEKFCQEILAFVAAPIGFADVGSGGALKSPWTLLPTAKLHKFNFDPEELRQADQLPICVSNHSGEQIFYIAQDPRSSSLHPSALEFVERFDQKGLLTKEEIKVMLTTLDELFAGRFREADLLDINVEGHDFQVLEGASRLFAEGFVKCVKIEFELIQVWEGQGWFGDIDKLMRERGYSLASIDIECSRPVSARPIFHAGEPLWGKALYTPNSAYWTRMQKTSATQSFQDDVLKAVALYVILDLPGRALDLLNLIPDAEFFSPVRKAEIAAMIHTVYLYSKYEYVLMRLARRVPFLARAFNLAGMLRVEKR